MKFIFKTIASFSIGLVLSASLQAQTIAELDARRVLLPNGWSITPVGASTPLGDLPLNIVQSHHKKWFAVTSNGQSAHALELIDAHKGTKIDSINIPKAWYGLAFSKDDQLLYASGGHDNMVRRYRTEAGKLRLQDSFLLGRPWPVKIGAAGLAVDDVLMNRLYVVSKESMSLYVFDLSDRRLLQTIALGSEGYTCLLSKDRSTLYVSLWGSKKIAEFDTRALSLRRTIEVGDHPNELLLDKKGARLFVANAQDNSVSILDTKSGQVTETLNAALYPGSPTGSTSNGLALSEDERTLYIANADNNCLAVFDVSANGRSRSKGFIPTGWYPTNLKVYANQLFVLNGKGLQSFANPNGPNPANKKQVVVDHKGDPTKPASIQYIGSLLKGVLSRIPVPTAGQLELYTKAVYSNTPYSKSKELQTEGMEGNPIPRKVGEASPIKYVFYIIKENRTYDQVLSDVKGGNGDTSLLLFGDSITPNQHKIARDFVLLDNFYVDAEVSADGHNWSMGAYANDYVEKNWPASYGNKGGTHATSGTLKIGNNREGFIWENCARQGVRFRNYGCFVEDKRGLKPRLPVLVGQTAVFPNYTLQVMDTTRFGYWKRDFDSLLKINQLPRFHTIRMGNDHTEGMRAGRPTPYAHVADNDLAVGLFLEHLSNSPVWKESAVFILEDDAQNGPDHVDAHRSTAYLAGPFVKRGYIDHTMYTTSGMLRTMELILGLPPMTQFDAAATPMWRAFTPIPDYTPFQHIPAKVNLKEVNPSNTPLAEQSEAFNWDEEDEVPDLLFNQILWAGLKGKMAPAPRRAGFVKERIENRE
jgi:YVTN family beta-propeller protein